MCDKNDRFAIQLLLNAFFENVFSNMSINSWEWIIQKEDVPVGVDSTSHADPLLLPSWQVQPPLTNLSWEQ